MNDIFPIRKEIRLKKYDYSSPGAYFITICTKDRKNLFWNGEIDSNIFGWSTVGANCVRPNNLPLSDLGKIVYSELEHWSTIYEGVFLPLFVIMPNHLHIIVAIHLPKDGRTQFAPTISRMVKQFKGSITKKVNKSIWQKSFIEHIIRDQQDYDTRQNYIIENPLKWYYDELFYD